MLVFMIVLVLVGMFAFVTSLLASHVPRASRQGVPFQQIKAFDVDEHGPVVGRAGRLEDADDLEAVVLVPLRADAVRRIESRRPP